MLIDALASLLNDRNRVCLAHDPPTCCEQEASRRKTDDGEANVPGTEFVAQSAPATMKRVQHTWGVGFPPARLLLAPGRSHTRSRAEVRRQSATSKGLKHRCSWLQVSGCQQTGRYDVRGWWTKNGVSGNWIPDSQRRLLPTNAQCFLVRVTTE